VLATLQDVEITLPCRGTEEREKVIHSTYDNAIADGDENVYYINGSDLLPPEQRAQYLVDGKHPNDLGMKLIATLVYEL
jgi:lysophospholipase L1-like esterase